jgi:hypothetical protein
MGLRAWLSEVQFFIAKLKQRSFQGMPLCVARFRLSLLFHTATTPHHSIPHPHTTPFSCTAIPPHKGSIAIQHTAWLENGCCIDHFPAGSVAHSVSDAAADAGADLTQSTEGETSVAVVFRPMARTSWRGLRYGETRSADREWPHGFYHPSSPPYPNFDISEMKIQISWTSSLMGTGPHNPRRNGHVLKGFDEFGPPPSPYSASPDSCRHPSSIFRSLRFQPPRSRGLTLCSHHQILTVSPHRHRTSSTPSPAPSRASLTPALAHKSATCHVAMSTRTHSHLHLSLYQTTLHQAALYASAQHISVPHSDSLQVMHVQLPVLGTLLRLAECATCPLCHSQRFVRHCSTPPPQLCSSLRLLHSANISLL